MRNFQAVFIIIMVMAMACTPGYAGTPPGSHPETSPKASEDARLPIHQQEKWQFFVSPYLWIPGVNINTHIAGHTTSIDVPWWDIAGKLFSQAIGAMGRLEAWKGRWGFFLDSYFVYLDGTVT